MSKRQWWVTAVGTVALVLLSRGVREHWLPAWLHASPLLDRACEIVPSMLGVASVWLLLRAQRRFPRAALASSALTLWTVGTGQAPLAAFPLILAIIALGTPRRPNYPLVRGCVASSFAVLALAVVVPF